MWLDKLKIAIVEKDLKALDSLLEDVPDFEDKKDIEAAIYLLREATVLMQSLKEETKASMKQIKKNLDFLRSTDIRSSRKLDLKS